MDISICYISPATLSLNERQPTPGRWYSPWRFAWWRQRCWNKGLPSRTPPLPATTKHKKTKAEAFVTFGKGRGPFHPPPTLFQSYFDFIWRIEDGLDKSDIKLPRWHQTHVTCCLTLTIWVSGGVMPIFSAQLIQIVSIYSITSYQFYAPELLLYPTVSMVYQRVVSKFSSSVEAF